jgi:hypothetical protein
MAVTDALTGQAEHNARKNEIVELRFFQGLNLEDGRVDRNQRIEVCYLALCTKI